MTSAKGVWRIALGRVGPCRWGGTEDNEAPSSPGRSHWRTGGLADWTGKMTQPNANAPTLSQLRVSGDGTDATPKALKPAVDEATLLHKKFLEGPFWQKIPAYAKVPEEQFLDHKWQAKSSIINVGKLLAAVQDLVSPDFISDAEEGFRHAPMSVRV